MFHLCCTSVRVSFQYLETKLFIDYFRVGRGGGALVVSFVYPGKMEDQFYVQERTENVTSAFFNYVWFVIQKRRQVYAQLYDHNFFDNGTCVDKGLTELTIGSSQQQNLIRATKLVKCCSK